MKGPLAGIRVVELGVVIAGPAAASVLADWGADVIKIEPPSGDPARGNVEPAFFAMDNRSKRSITLDLGTDEGRRLARRLVVSSDVFVTNLRTSALRRLGLDYDSLLVDAPRLVYGAITGFGDSDAAGDRPGYDVGAFWARTGIGYSLTRVGSEPPVPRPGMGDHTTGLAAASGIVAALYSRERTGRGQRVATSLMRAGAYVLGTELNAAVAGRRRPAGLERMMFNPLLAVYRSSDEQWFWLLGVQPTRHWASVCRAIGRPELIDDERFTTIETLISNRAEVLSILDQAFTSHPMAYWIDRFTEHDVWWDPQQSFEDAVADPLMHGAGVIRPLADEVGSATIATPVDFGADELAPPRRHPEAGQHTEEVLLEFGYSWDDITALKDAGALG